MWSPGVIGNGSHAPDTPSPSGSTTTGSGNGGPGSHAASPRPSPRPSQRPRREFGAHMGGKYIHRCTNHGSQTHAWCCTVTGARSGWLGQVVTCACCAQNPARAGRRGDRGGRRRARATRRRPATLSGSPRCSSSVLLPGSAVQRVGTGAAGGTGHGRVGAEGNDHRATLDLDEYLIVEIADGLLVQRKLLQGLLHDGSPVWMICCV